MMAACMSARPRKGGIAAIVLRLSWPVTWPEDTIKTGTSRLEELNAKFALSSWKTWTRWKSIEELFTGFLSKQWNKLNFLGQEQLGIAAAEDGRFTCLKCLVSFTNSSNAYRHYRNSHFAIEPVPCKICGKTFKHQDSLNKHLRIQHGLSATMLNNQIIPEPRRKI